MYIFPVKGERLEDKTKNKQLSLHTFPALTKAAHCASASQGA